MEIRAFRILLKTMRLSESHQASPSTLLRLTKPTFQKPSLLAGWSSQHHYDSDTFLYRSPHPIQLLLRCLRAYQDTCSSYHPYQILMGQAYRGGAIHAFVFAVGLAFPCLSLVALACTEEPRDQATSIIVGIFLHPLCRDKYSSHPQSRTEDPH